MDYIAFKSLPNELNRSNKNRIESCLLENHDNAETHKESRVYSYKGCSSKDNKEIDKNMKILMEGSFCCSTFHQ